MGKAELNVIAFIAEKDQFEADAFIDGVYVTVDAYDATEDENQKLLKSVHAHLGNLIGETQKAT